MVYKKRKEAKSKEDAEKVIEIILKADSGCEYYVSELLNLFCNAFPEHEELAQKMFKRSTGNSEIIRTIGKDLKELPKEMRVKARALKNIIVTDDHFGTGVKIKPTKPKA